MTKRFWAHATASIAICIGGAAVLTACLPPGVACPAIMYLSSVDVHVDGELAWLDACVGSDCGSSVGDYLGNLAISERASGIWTIEFHSGAPDALKLQAFDTSGVLVAEEDYELVWTPVGDPGPCPGPVETADLKFSIEAG